MLKCLCLLAAVLLLPRMATAETLIFAPMPMESAETVATQWKPLIDYLEKTLGVSLRIEYSKDNKEIVGKFRRDAIDLAQMGSLPYLALKEECPQAQPLVLFREKSGAASYTCAIVAPAEAHLSLTGMSGLKVALTQPLSTCGYFSTEGLLRQAGSSLEQNRYRYLTQHDEVALAVVRGEFDAGGLKTAIAQKYAHLGLVVVAETDPVPGLGLIANSQRISAERLEQIRQALLAAGP